MSKNSVNVTPMSSAERRYAKKQAAEKAKRNAKRNKIIWTAVGIVAAIGIICLVAYNISLYVGLVKPEENVGKGLDESGMVAGINAEDYVTTVDIYNMVIDKTTVSVSSEEIQQEIDEVLEYYSDGETTPVFDDAFVQETLELDQTADEYRADIEQKLYDEKLETAVSELLQNNSVLKQIPEYFDTYVQVQKYITQYSFEQINSYVQSLTGSSIAANYIAYSGCKNEKEFDKKLKESCEKELAVVLAKEVIFEKAGLAITDEEYEQFIEDNNMSDEAGKPYIMQCIIDEKVIAYIKENAKIQ